MIISAAKASEAAEVLGVELTGLTPGAVGTAYRAKAKNCHPDHHGSTKLQEWARVSWAKDCLYYWLEQQPKREDVTLEKGDCLKCGGTGRIAVAKQRFGPALNMICPVCKGNGTIIPEENDID